jgi:hypothetical protein
MVNCGSFHGCAVPTGLRFLILVQFPTLKRGANNHCATARALWPRNLAASVCLVRRAPELGLRWPEFAVSAFDVVPKGIGEIGAEFVGHAAGCALHFFHQALEIIAGTRNGGDGESR